MIQFNLLPDVKVQYLKTRYRKRLIIAISSVVSAVFLFVFAFLFLFVRVNQKNEIKALEKDVASQIETIKKVEDLDKILTIQNQLNSLPKLHSDKVISSRLSDYLVKLTPNEVTISDVNVEFNDKKMIIKGNADGLPTVNKFVDTLKFTDFVVNEDKGKSGKAFKNVVLNSYSIAKAGQSSQSNRSSYEISFEFDPEIFGRVDKLKDGATEPVSLTVPSIISTRSATEKPATLFVPQPQPEPATPVQEPFTIPGEAQ